MTVGRLDGRARRHPVYAAWLLHRLSGLALAMFLPLHFALLAQAMHGAAGLDRALALTHSPWVKVAEWGLVVLLALHLTGGIRLLLIEFGPWRGLLVGWIAGSAAYFSDRGRLIQADRGRRFNVIVNGHGCAQAI